MTHDQFVIKARAYIIRTYRTLSAGSLEYGDQVNMFSRCIMGERDFPDAFLLEMGFKPPEKRKVYTRYTKAELKAMEEEA